MEASEPSASRAAENGDAPSFKFSEEQTKRLIVKRFEMEALFTGKRNSSRQAWLRIIQELELWGATPEQCRKKWLNLLRKYKELKNPPTGAGSEDGELDWPYFQLLDDRMSGRPIISPPRLISSAQGGSSAAGSSIAERPAAREDSEPRLHEEQRRKRPRNSGDVAERLLNNMERQTEIMSKIFDFFVSKHS